MVREYQAKSRLTLSSLMIVGVFIGLSLLPALAQEHLPKREEASGLLAQAVDTVSALPFVDATQKNLEKIHSADNNSMPTKRIVIPLLEQPDLSLAIPAIVNNSMLSSFLIDEKTDYTIITPGLAKKLGIVINEITPTITMKTKHGLARLPVVTLKNVSLGHVTVSEVQAVVQELDKGVLPSGQLGKDYFQGMNFLVSKNNLILQIPISLSAFAE